MRQRGWGQQPGQAVRFEWKLPEQGREDAHRVDRGADIVRKARQRQFSAAGPAADLMRSLDNRDLRTRAGQLDGGGQSVRTRTDDDCVQLVLRLPARCQPTSPDSPRSKASACSAIGQG